jgi:hypothetical protein
VVKAGQAITVAQWLSDVQLPTLTAMSSDHPRKKDRVPNEFNPAWAGPEYWLFFQQHESEKAQQHIEKVLNSLRQT